MATNKEIIEKAYASFATGDVPAPLGAMADDIQWTESDGFPLAGTYVGPQAVLKGVFMRLGEIGDDFAVVPEQFVADGDTVVALGSCAWKHKSSGEPAMVKMVHVWTMDGGKAVAFQQHIDTVKVRELSSTREHLLHPEAAVAARLPSCNGDHTKWGRIGQCPMTRHSCESKLAGFASIAPTP
jgi:uncharacterized protein